MFQMLSNTEHTGNKAKEGGFKSKRNVTKSKEMTKNRYNYGKPSCFSVFFCKFTL